MIGAVAVAQENIDIIASSNKNSMSLTQTIAKSSDKPGQMVGWQTSHIEEKMSDERLAKTEFTNSLAMEFLTGQSPGVLQADQYVMAWASFPDPDAEGNYSSVTCTVQYKPVVEGGNTWSALADVSVWNLYGTQSINDLGTYSNIQNAALANGPWVSAAGTNDSATAWKSAFMKESDPDTSVKCSVARLIGPVPSSVIPKSSVAGSLKLFWGEIEGFVDVKSGVNYQVLSGYKIFDAS